MSPEVTKVASRWALMGASSGCTWENWDIFGGILYPFMPIFARSRSTFSADNLEAMANARADTRRGWPFFEPTTLQLTDLL